jgi:hypothetical protein
MFAPERYAEITNNDNGLKRTSFPIIGFEGLEIDGGGSEFIFHDNDFVPFLIEESENIALKNFSVDWNSPFTLEGKVVARNPAEHSFDIQIKTPYKVEFERLYLCLERPNTPYEKKFGDRFSIAEKDYIEVGQNIVWNPESMRPYYNTVRYAMPEIGLKAIELEKGLVRLTAKNLGNNREVPPLGSIFVSKGEYLFNRTSPAIRIFKAKEVLLNNIDIHHAGAMGLIAERSETITLDNFNVKLKEGSGRMITTTADATHFCNVKGMVTIKNCLFENMLDDATNIHGTYVRVNKIISDNQVAVETYHPHQKGYLFGEAGDSVAIIKKENLQTVSEGLIITEVDRINDKISILTFNQSVAGIVGLHDGIENTSWVSTAIIENNVVRNNRARSFLISTPKKVIVRNNKLSSQMASLRITGDLNRWNESGPCLDLLIENNTFEDCVYGGNRQSIIQIDPQYNFPGYEGTYYSKNIVIRNNTFHSFDASIMKAISVDGLEFSNNTISPSGTYPPIFPDQPYLEIINCKDVVMTKNNYEGSTNQMTWQADAFSKDIKVSENTNFQKIQ